MTELNSSSANIFVPLLAVLFIGLKLTDHIEWSWWWVLSPIPISSFLGAVLGALADVRGEAPHA